MRCVTGFGIYNCLTGLQCDGQQMDVFSGECLDFCWVDADCGSGQCDERLNRCR